MNWRLEVVVVPVSDVVSRSSICLSSHERDTWAMSQENVDFVRGLFGGAAGLSKEAIADALPAIVATAFTEDAEWVEDPQRADRQTWRGHAGILESWRRWLDEWEDYSFEVTGLEDHGDHVFVVSHEEARGSSSGASVSADNYIVVTFRDGKIARYQEFYEEDDARAALEPG
jgi:ketosteroid isomerase-like protein